MPLVAAGRQTRAEHAFHPTRMQRRRLIQSLTMSAALSPVTSMNLCGRKALVLMFRSKRGFCCGQQATG